MMQLKIAELVLNNNHSLTQILTIEKKIKFLLFENKPLKSNLEASYTKIKEYERECWRVCVSQKSQALNSTYIQYLCKAITLRVNLSFKNVLFKLNFDSTTPMMDNKTDEFIVQEESFSKQRIFFMNVIFFRLQKKVKKHNLIVASYDVVRNDVDFFG